MSFPSLRMKVFLRQFQEIIFCLLLGMLQDKQEQGALGRIASFRNEELAIDGLWNIGEIHILFDHKFLQVAF